MKTLIQGVMMAVLLLGLPAAQAQGLVTDCDRLAAHPLDPDKITPGVSTSQVDRLAGIAACREAVAADPDNPRLIYSLGRVLFYRGGDLGPDGAGRKFAEEGRKYIIESADMGYTQAMHVAGLLYQSGGGGPQDICKTRDYWRRAAADGRYSTVISLSRLTMRGGFASCRGDGISPEDIKGYLDVADSAPNGYLDAMLIADLKAEWQRIYQQTE